MQVLSGQGGLKLNELVGQIWNVVEDFWWIGAGMGLVWWNLRGKSRGSKFVWILSGLLVVFGVTDFVEVFTGAWWRPLWLLMLKAGCIFAAVVCIWKLWRSERLKK